MAGNRLPAEPDYLPGYAGVEDGGQWLAPFENAGLIHEAQNPTEVIAERLGEYFPLSPGSLLTALPLDAACHRACA
jgi:hypothetical protein